MALNPTVTPSGNFDLRNWKITLPVDSAGKFSGTAVEVLNLSGYQSKYFYTAPDGAMVFYAPVEGATTSGSSYARSELREMNGSDRAAWNLSTGGVLSATLEVDAAPLRDGAGGRLIVGQIHGQDEELVRLVWENNTVYFVNDQAGSGNVETKFAIRATDGSTPDVSLNEKFSYSIMAKGNVLDVDIYADGKHYESVTTINSVWSSDSFYFKAGAYLGANETNGSGYGQASFYDLTFNHTGTVPTPPVPAPDPVPTDPVPGPGPVPVPDRPLTTTTKTGGSSADRLTGTSGNDLIEGKAGDDMLWGKEGSDVLIGGAGKDAFTFDTKLGPKNVDIIVDFDVANDTIRLNDTIFTKLDHGNLKASAFVLDDHAHDRSDRILYDQDTGFLFYDKDGTGSSQAVHFATIENKAALTFADFLVI